MFKFQSRGDMTQGDGVPGSSSNRRKSSYFSGMSSTKKKRKLTVHLTPCFKNGFQLNQKKMKRTMRKPG